MQPNNDDRADWAESAVRYFGMLTRMDTAGESLATMLGDLMANLVHLCDREGLDFDEVVRGAKSVAAEEVEEEWAAE